MGLRVYFSYILSQFRFELDVHFAPSKKALEIVQPWTGTGAENHIKHCPVLLRAHSWQGCAWHDLVPLPCEEIKDDPFFFWHMDPSSQEPEIGIHPRGIPRSLSIK